MEIQQRKRVAITSSFFPVDESLLPQLSLSDEQKNELRSYAIQAAMDTVRDGPTWGRSNVEHAVASGWKVLSARPTACFMTKRQDKKKKAAKKAAPLQEQSNGQEDDKRATPPTPRVTVPGITSLGSFHGADILRTPLPFQPFVPVPLESTSGQHFMAHAVLPNSLEDVMNTLYCENTREMRALKRKVYGEAALDCCVLQTIDEATSEDPFWYLGLKWLALRSPMQALMASREFVYLEHLGTHIDPETGRRLLYRVAHSVHIRGYGGQDSYFGLTRGHIEAAFVYWMDDENEEKNPLLHVCAKGRMHMKGSMPDGLVYKYLKSFWRSERSLFPANRSSGSSLGITISSTVEYVPKKASKKRKKKKKSRRRKVPSGPPLEMAHEWVADELRPRCSVCNKKFRLVRRFKHHCRACGEVICRECTFHHRVNVRATQSFRGLRGTVGTGSVDIVSDTKEALNGEPAMNFEETMTCSFDNQVVDEETKGEFDASASLVNARKAVNGPLETAVLGGDAIVCVVMAKVCLRCLQSVPLINRSKSKSTVRRRHSALELDSELPADILEGGGEAGFDDEFPVRPQTWTPDNREIEELDGLDDEISGHTAAGGRREDLPMLVVDDTDAESVDDYAETKRRPGSYAFDVRPGSSMYVRPGSYAQEWNSQEDGGLDSHANHERVMILSPHALSTTSSVSSSQMHTLLEKDESGHDSSERSDCYPSHHHYDIPSDAEDDIQFYPTQSKRAPDADSEAKSAEGSHERMSSYTGGFDPNSLFELKDDENELAVSAAAAKASVSATEKVLRRMRELQDEALYQNRQVPSPSSSTTSLYSEDGGECSEIDEPMQDLRQALAQVESSLADQARILFTIEQERKKEVIAAGSIAAVATPKA